MRGDPSQGTGHVLSCYHLFLPWTNSFYDLYYMMMIYWFGLGLRRGFRGLFIVLGFVVIVCVFRLLHSAISWNCI